MVFFSLFMWWAYSSNEYLVPGAKKTSIWRPLWDSINYTDFVVEIFGSLKYFFSAATGKASSSKMPNRISVDSEGKAKMNFGEAFGVAPSYAPTLASALPPHMAADSTTGLALRTRRSYDEEIRLAPYTYGEPAPPLGRQDSFPSPGPSPTAPHFAR